jgi:hypothetical protein
VVYSSFFGTREPLNPRCFDAAGSINRVVFTDNPELVVEGATTVLDPLDGLDAHRASRRAKLMPHRYFPDHDWSIYLDNNATLLCDPAKIIAEVQSQQDHVFFAFRHWLRDCVYEEADACIWALRDDPTVIQAQMDFYRSQGMPRKNGLIAGSFLVRRHNDPAAIRLGERWFEQVLRHSRRDQLSCNFAAWKTGAQISYFDGLLPDEANPFVKWPAMKLAKRQPDNMFQKKWTKAYLGLRARRLLGKLQP